MFLWPVSHSFPKAPQANPCEVCGILHDHRGTFVGHPDVCGAVPVLSVAAGPLCIPWFVVAIVIDALKGHSFRDRPHVSQKGVEVQPPRMDGYSPTTVPMIGRVCRSQTPGLHVIPSSVRRANAARPRISVSQRFALLGGMAARVGAVFPGALLQMARESFKSLPAALASNFDPIRLMGFLFTAAGSGAEHAVAFGEPARGNVSREIPPTLRASPVYNWHRVTFSPGGSREVSSEVGRLFPDFSAAKPIRAEEVYAP